MKGIFVSRLSSLDSEFYFILPLILIKVGI